MTLQLPEQHHQSTDRSLFTYCYRLKAVSKHAKITLL